MKIAVNVDDTVLVVWNDKQNGKCSVLLLKSMNRTQTAIEILENCVCDSQSGSFHWHTHGHKS